MSTPRARLRPLAPDRGSFPLDHFHECDTKKHLYMKCLTEHAAVAHKCNEITKEYLLCRMQNGLMAPEELSKLGFKEEEKYENPK